MTLLDSKLNLTIQRKSQQQIDFKNTLRLQKKTILQRGILLNIKNKIQKNEVNDNLSSNGSIVLTLNVANGYGYI